MNAPSRPELHDRLMQLLAGELSRGEMTSWANQWVAADDPEVEDRVVWKALKRLSAADLLVSATDYFYGEEDFQAWIEELENAAE